MRNLLLFGCLSLALGCATPKNNSKKPVVLNGSWTPVKQQISGKDLPSSTFQTQKLVINGTSYTLSAESIDKGTVNFKNGQMDIYGKEGVNAGKHFTAIYKLENDQLTICYNLRGDAYPKEFETTSSPALFLSVFKKD